MVVVTTGLDCWPTTADVVMTFKFAVMRWAAAWTWAGVRLATETTVADCVGMVEASELAALVIARTVCTT